MLVTLGGLLILAEEVQIQRLIRGAALADLCILEDMADAGSAASAPGKSDPSAGAIGSARWPWLGALEALEGIGTCYVCGSVAALRDLVGAGSQRYVPWPAFDDRARSKHPYGSTVYAQSFYRARGFVPHLACKPEARLWAHRFVEDYVAPDLPVVVHLKNNPAAPGESNANADAWPAFFEACRGRYDVRFLLIGDDELDGRVRALPNVLVTRERGATLAQDLALIQHAFAFMGMASGPCNMAIFSDTPYVIYKHPDHHPDEMHAELGEADHFPFGTPLQRFVRAFETPEDLLARFAAIYAHADPAAWVRRLAAPR